MAKITRRKEAGPATPIAAQVQPTWQLEYSAGLQQYRHYSDRRRQDMAFVTTLQIAILGLLGARLGDLDTLASVLSVFAGFVALMGMNNESRLSSHMKGYMRRVEEIEREQGMSLLDSDRRSVAEAKWVLRNTFLFRLYYAVILIMWSCVWIINVYSYLQSQ
jgi:hypothetical protein